MAQVNQHVGYQHGLTFRRAVYFNDGDVLVDTAGRVGIRTEHHIVRNGGQFLGEHTLWVMDLHESGDLFTLAPAGTSFTVRAA